MAKNKPANTDKPHPKLIATNAIVKHCNCKANGQDLGFDNMQFSTKQVQQISDWIEAKQEVRVSIAQNKEPYSVEPISKAAIIKSCKINSTCQDLKFDGFKFDSEQIADINNYIISKELITVSIFPTQGELFQEQDNDQE